MDTSQDMASHANKLCMQCSTIDFESLFSSNIKTFCLGKLSTIMQNETCPFCCLAVHAINNKSREFGDSWTTADPTLINVWVKTTFWARYNDGVVSGDERTSNSAKLRYRPALGIDWMPVDRRHWDRAKCLTICEFDSVLIEQCHSFPANFQQDYSQILRRRLVSAEVDLTLVRSWVEECELNHHHPIDRLGFQTQLRATGHFRLYDVVQSRLIEPAGHVEYMALSYVWGDALRERQLANPVSWWSDFFEDIEPCQSAMQGRHVHFCKLPRTIQDASFLVQRLGWRYLWVDLLCVCQDDLPKKQLLIDRMHVVYKGASVTLIAAGGNDAESPLHGLRSGTRLAERSWIIPTRGGNLRLAIAKPGLQELLASTEWISRGWTFQEDILSSCCLYFTQEEVFYSCDVHTPVYRLQGLDRFGGFPGGRLSEWRESYVLETKSTLTAYQSLCQWNEAWSRSATHGLRFVATAEQLWQYPILARRSVDAHDLQVNHRNWDFYDYAFLVCKYSKRKLTKQGDIVNAFLGVLNQFVMQRTLDADIKFHGLFRDELSNNSLGRALLWIPSRATALHRRCAESNSGTAAPQQYPSWSWSGWVGEIDYPITRSGCYSAWNFSPARFAPKQDSLHMKDVFQWSTQNDDRVIAWLKEFAYIRGETPAKIGTHNNFCTLTLFTHVTETRLTQEHGFMSQNHQTWTDRLFYNMHPKDRGLSRYGERLTFEKSSPPSFSSKIAILPDAGTQSTGKDYKLACIGQGGMFRDYVVLLLEQTGDFYERRGLSTVEPQLFQWTLEWIDIA